MTNKNWEKEDRHCWQKSEVMQNFEKAILENYAKLSTAEQKLDVPKVTKELNEANQSAEKLVKTLGGSSADDGLQEDEECASCSFSESEADDEEVIEAKASVLAELRKMAEDAIADGNIKLAYQVERTIAEMLEPLDEE